MRRRRRRWSEREGEEKEMLVNITVQILAVHIITVQILTSHPPVLSTCIQSGPIKTNVFSHWTYILLAQNLCQAGSLAFS